MGRPFGITDQVITTDFPAVLDDVLITKSGFAVQPEQFTGPSYKRVSHHYFRLVSFCLDQQAFFTFFINHKPISKGIDLRDTTNEAGARLIAKSEAGETGFEGQTSTDVWLWKY